MKKAMPRVHLLDACGPDAGEPVALVLDTLDQLAPGEHLHLRIEREPFQLYRLLSDKAYAYCTQVLNDASFEVSIWRCGRI